MSNFEFSGQTIPLTPEIPSEAATSVPLYNLRHTAPKLWPLKRCSSIGVPYSFSNDESAAYYDQTRARTATAEYGAATNRTAIVVGEGALLASLAYIPEETVILVDESADMCRFMKTYVDSLRSSESIDEWRHSVVTTSDMSDRLESQATEWVDTGYDHPLTNSEAYDTARTAAQEKAIIPWRANIGNKRQMRRLGDALRDNDANVTMLNLTNVLTYDPEFTNAQRAVQTLKELPLTPHAPILTTNATAKTYPMEPWRTPIVQATGPFFGLENLYQHGGNTQGLNRGSVAERQYAPGANHFGFSREEMVVLKDFMDGLTVQISLMGDDGY